MGQDLVQTALGWLSAYGAAAVMLVLLLAASGVPAPATVTLLAAGSLVREGRLNAPLVLGAAILGAVIGDGVSYGMGRYGLGGLKARLERGRSFRRAEEAFRKRGGTSAVLLTRTLLTPLALPTNLLCGGDRYPFAKFAGLCAAGHAVYFLAVGGAGYALGSGWRAAQGAVGSVAVWGLVGAVVLFGLYELTHWHGHLTPHRERADDARAR